MMKLDSKQIFIAEKLTLLAKELEENYSRHRASKITFGLEKMLSNFFSAKESSDKKNCFYIYGDVGRGKSMLMQNFFNSLTQTTKIYFHFNGFMRSIHEALRNIRHSKQKFKDELIEAVKRVVGGNNVICFDEFQVVDITDAMLLSRIFSYLFSQKKIVILTSNSHPLELYKNGLQREIFLEFVTNILLKNCEVLHLDSKIDYREKFINNFSERYICDSSKFKGFGKKACKKFREIIAIFSEEKTPKILKIKVWGREIKIRKTFTKKSFGRIAQISFNEICKENYAASDYQAICQNFDLIFLAKVPILGNEEANEIRRFTLFIDEVYEQKVALIILAKTLPENTCTSINKFEYFRRTVSRLNEIKSDQYWLKSKFKQRKTTLK